MTMDIRELKAMDVSKVIELAAELKIESPGNLPYRDLVYKVIYAAAAARGSVAVAEGVLEKLNDGYGFLRASEASYLKGPSYAWMCMKFACPGGEGFVTRDHWEEDRPYRRCADINRHGACPLWEKAREPEEET